jgi:hypothetical protein
MLVFSKGCPEIFASRMGIVSYSIFNVNNFRLAVNMTVNLSTL